MTKLKNTIPVFCEVYFLDLNRTMMLYKVQKYPHWGIRIIKEQNNMYMEFTINLN